MATGSKHYSEKERDSSRWEDISVAFTGIVFCVFFLPAVVLQFFMESITIPNFDTIYRGIRLVALVSAISLGLSIRFEKYKLCGFLTIIAIIGATTMTYSALKTRMDSGIVDQKYEHFDQETKRHLLYVYIRQDGELNQYTCNRDDWLKLKTGQAIEFKVAMDYITYVY